MTTLDKYEYNLKLEEIDKLVDQRDYQEAAKLADTIDWRRVRNVRTLCLISERRPNGWRTARAFSCVLTDGLPPADLFCIAW